MPLWIWILIGIAYISLAILFWGLCAFGGRADENLAKVYSLDQRRRQKFRLYDERDHTSYAEKKEIVKDIREQEWRELFQPFTDEDDDAS